MVQDTPLDLFMEEIGVCLSRNWKILEAVISSIPEDTNSANLKKLKSKLEKHYQSLKIGSKELQSHSESLQTEYEKLNEKIKENTINPTL